MNGLYWILHLLGCPDEELIEEYGGKQLRCKKCGRTQFVFRTY